MNEEIPVQKEQNLAEENNDIKEQSENKTHNKIMKPIRLALNYLLGIAGFIGLVITFIQYFEKDTIEIEFKIIDKVQLTKDLNIEDLTIKYKDSEINNLWKIKYLILNTGKRSILGKGNKKDIFTENLPIKFKDSVKVLSTKIDDANFTISIDSTDNILGLAFREWKNSKALIITSIVENLGEAVPSVYIDENDINDSKINIFEYNPKADKKLIERFARGKLFLILKWEAVLLVVISSLSLWWLLVLQDALKEKSNKLLKIAKITVYSLFFFIATLLPLLWIF